MRLLLDTHIWVWSLDEPGRLSVRVAEALGSSENEVWLSPISVWEVLLLAQKGRLVLEPEPYQWIRRALGASAPREAALNYHVAIRSREIRLDLEDPADRFLVATAELYQLTLVTEDERLLAASGWEVLSNQ
ncbi:MAG: type II toxin-antitoxin system VapC family toxin [Gemmatimonadetes bacterium]|nr:type II toxin-antitoxin system VapC family toxin [Gemmatimonadota bacterium]